MGGVARDLAGLSCLDILYIAVAGVWGRGKRGAFSISPFPGCLGTMGCGGRWPVAQRDPRMRLDYRSETIRTRKGGR
jgi:hypothetical protein